ncbi:hypothetical protein HBB16_16355 [Pseudonocardia sp. MCCB 268]|nr:hypothetical protein [Pseudonocardia cytotoxica]
MTDAAVAELRELVPPSPRRVVEAGHMVTGDDNGVFTEHLVDFLTRIARDPKARTRRGADGPYSQPMRHRQNTRWVRRPPSRASTAAPLVRRPGRGGHHQASPDARNAQQLRSPPAPRPGAGGTCRALSANLPRQR